jgi:hypothetical protein
MPEHQVTDQVIMGMIIKSGRLGNNSLYSDNSVKRLL